VRLPTGLAGAWEHAAVDRHARVLTRMHHEGRRLTEQLVARYHKQLTAK
jgi:hypothetical protein